jgi:hypothetical protein
MDGLFLRRTDGKKPLVQTHILHGSDNGGSMVKRCHHDTSKGIVRGASFDTKNYDRMLGNSAAFRLRDRQTVLIQFGGLRPHDLAARIDRSGHSEMMIA